MAIDLDKLEDASHLLSILLQMEDVLDSLDLYCFENWLDGEVVEGPIIRRHWVSMSLLYPSDKMPDPRAALRLLKHHIMVEFDKIERTKTGTPKDTRNANTPGAGTSIVQAKAGKERDWLVKITVPRRLLDQIAAADADTYEDDVEIDDVESAKDSGLDDQTAYTENQTDDAAPPNDPTVPDMAQEATDGFPK